jgi:hypothetical protein
MQQALIPLAAAAGLVALAGGAAALWMRSPDATPEWEDKERKEQELDDDEYGTPEPEAVEEDEELEDEYSTPEPQAEDSDAEDEDRQAEHEYSTPEPQTEDSDEEDEEPQATEEARRGSVAVETCTVEQQLQAIKDDIVSKVREGVYDRKRALYEWTRQSLRITTQPNTIRCRVPPNYKKELWDEIDKEFKR